MSYTFFCHNIQVTAADGCTWTPPSGTITAELIYRETGDVGNGGLWGTLGADLTGRLIANTTGRKIIVSDDYGDTWTEYSTACPDSFNNPGVNWLRPTMWQYFDGKWRAHLRDNDANEGNVHAYAADFVSGTFTFGYWNDDRGAPPTYQEVGLRNGEYTSASMHWDIDGVVVAGSWGADGSYPGTNIGGTFGNYLAIARHGSYYGDQTVPAEYINLRDNGVVYRVLPLSDGYYAAVHTNTTLYGYKLNNDLSSAYQDSIGADTIRFNNHTGNGIDTVLQVRQSNVINRWTNGSPPVWDTVSPNTGGTSSSAGWSGAHWLVAGGTGASTSLRTSYTTDPTAASFTQGPTVTLPAALSSAGSDGQLQNVMYAGNGIWVGFYIRATDRKIDIYRFTYGTLEGNCA